MEIFKILRQIALGLSIVFGIHCAYGSNKECQTHFTNLKNNRRIAKKSEPLLQQLSIAQVTPHKIKPRHYIRLIKRIMRISRSDLSISFAIRSSFKNMMAHHNFTRKQIIQLIKLLSPKDQKYIINQMVPQIDHPEGMAITRDHKTFMSLMKMLEKVLHPSIMSDLYSEVANKYKEITDSYDRDLDEAAQLLEEADRYNKAGEEYSRLAGNTPLPKRGDTNSKKPSEVYREAANMFAKAHVTAEKAEKIARKADDMQDLADRAFHLSEEMRRKAQKISAL